ncbi:uncharacterized protein LOC133920417 [Phragmites australis]|uniref:uncharacterized protein LOC133920417 n=1 Tax=Phragmites australis TaxID=29695 RepID=UPI002D76FBCE|nr:uncharacterized protein LOC133920417 [Phragmites australis]
MEFTSSYFHAFGNPDFAAVFSGGGGGGITQAFRPRPSADVDAPGAKAAAESRSPAARRAPSVFCVPDTEAEEAHHFLDECSLCRKALCGDIFMYRGDTPFCSDECRREQIEMDRVKHRRKKQHSPTAQQAAAVTAHREPPQRQLQPQH